VRSRWIGLRLAGAAVVLACAQFAVTARAVTSPASAASAASSPAVQLASRLMSPLAAPLTGLTPTPTTRARVAFTDDTDHIARFTPADGSFFADAAPGFASATAHEGELAVSETDTGVPLVTVFVSTRAGGVPDVFLSSSAFGAEPIRVTCDAATESHPVASAVIGTGSGRTVQVAYASTAGGAGNDGHVNIWVATVSVRAAPTSPAGCSPLVTSRVPLAHQRGDNLWPNWVGTQALAANSASVGNELVYSSTRDNPLGDIYQQCVDVCRDGNLQPVAGVDAGPSRRTFGPAGVANTEPVALNDPSGLDDARVYLALTTTRFRPDGSLGWLVLPPADVASVPAAQREVSSLYGDAPPQGAQPAFGDLCIGSENCAPSLAYTATGADPYGDVLLQQLTQDGGLIAIGAPVDVANTPGAAESQPAIVTGNNSDGEHAGVYITARSGSAGISTAVAADGAGRQPFLSADPDESQPVYSPDGTRLAYSQLVPGDPQSESPDRRVIMIADADGTGTPRQLASQDADGVEYDTEPAWSPDGTRIAFTRFALRNDVQSAAVMIADVPADATPSIPVQVTPHSVEPTAQVQDLDPSWSPDGTHLALVRSTPVPDLRLTLAPVAGATGVFVATVRNGTAVASANATLTITVGSTGDADNAMFLVTSGGLPAGVSCTSLPVPTAATRLRCVLGPLPGFASRQVTFSAVERGDAPFGVYELKAGVGAPSPDADLADNRAATTISLGEGGTGDFVAADPPVGTAISQTGWLRNDTQRDDVTRRSYPRPQLWVVNAATGQGGPITTTVPTSSGTACSATTPCAINGRSPAWSPDGARLAYDDSGMLRTITLPASIAGTPTSVPAQQVSALTGYELNFIPIKRAVPTPSRTSIAAAHDPTWSADGAQLYLAGEPARQVTNIGGYAIRPDGSGVRTVAQRPQPETEPTVQPPAPRARTADLGVTIHLSRPVGFVGGALSATVKIVNHGPLVATAATLTVTVPAALHPSAAPACLAGGTPCAVGTLAPGAQQSFVIALDPAPVGNPAHGYSRTLTATIASTVPDPVPANNSRSVVLPVKQPAIRLLPAIGPPGFVTLAFGEDFPAGDHVLLRWSDGITAFDGPYIVAADGTLRVQVLIVRRDLLGARDIVASSPAHLFSKVKGTMLVVPRTESPPRFLGRG
jgi:Tol biopolymer transport system component